tara:strand:+ start:1845 stop:4220 length:2376 start_codon:yes stop_codon:yes gene_type:complete
MFKKNRPRPARDALNRAGGIMSSSPELMNTVQRFQPGGSVTIPGGSNNEFNLNTLVATPQGNFIERQEERSIPKKITDYIKGIFSVSAEDARQKSVENPGVRVKADILTPTGTVVGGREVEGYPIFLNGKMIGVEGETSPGFFSMDYNIRPQSSDAQFNLMSRDPLEKARQAGSKDLSGLDIMADESYLQKLAEGLGQYGTSREGIQTDVNKQIAAGTSDLSSMDLIPGGRFSQLRDDSLDFKPTFLADRVKEEQDARRKFVEQEQERMQQGQIPPNKLVEVPEAPTQEEIKKEQFDRFREIELAEGTRARQIQDELEAAKIAEEFNFIQEQDPKKGADILAEVEGDADKAFEAAKTAEKTQKQDSILAEEKRMQQGQISASGENIAKSVETGNQDALNIQLKDLMAQFTSNAPKYKGLDKGMALMKIGFAMAAGRSPYAMQNIANALSDGADMFIKDKAQRDAFDRQVGLAALKYGMAEEATQRAQLRSDLRKRGTYVVGKGGVTIDGEFFEENRTVNLNENQIQTLGSKMKNLAPLDAIKELSDIRLAEMAALTSGLDPLKSAQALEQQKLYGENIAVAEEATRVIAIFDGLKKYITDPTTGPFSRGAKGLVGKAYTKGRVFLGLETDTVYNSEEEIKSRALSALGPIVKIALGNTQSANSISDRDVLFQIIQPFFGNIIQPQKNSAGVTTGFTVNLDDEALVLGQFDRAIDIALNSQRQALNKADSIHRNFLRVPSVEGFTGTGMDFISEEVKRRDVFDYGGGKGGIPTFNIDLNDKGELTGLTMVSS